MKTVFNVSVAGQLDKDEARPCFLLFNQAVEDNVEKIVNRVQWLLSNENVVVFSGAENDALRIKDQLDNALERFQNNNSLMNLSISLRPV